MVLSKMRCVKGLYLEKFNYYIEIELRVLSKKLQKIVQFLNMKFLSFYRIIIEYMCKIN